MKQIILTIAFLLFAFFSQLSAQVSNIHGAWIEVGAANDSLEVSLTILSKQQTLLPLAQTLSVYHVTTAGALVQQPALQLDRIISLDSNAIRYSVFRKRLSRSATSTLFAWNACCRGPLLNGTLASNNESMVAYTLVHPDVFGNGHAESIRLMTFPKMTYTRGLAQSSSLQWQQASTQHQTELSLSIPISGLVNNLFQPVSGTRLPTLNEMSIFGNEITVFAAEAGNLAFNIRYLTTTEENNNTLVLSVMEAAFQIDIQNASSVRNLLQDEGHQTLEIYDLLGRFLGNQMEGLQLAPGTYLFKRGNSFEKVQVF